MEISTILWITIFQFGIVILGIECINLGMISPVEVVEEWGCHDTEIRLTCGQLNSKLAILEATFTPNCTHEDCLRLDIKRLTRAFHSTPKPPNPRRAETEAGRKFLETLRKSPHSTDVDDDDDDDDDGLTDNGKHKKNHTNLEQSRESMEEIPLLLSSSSEEKETTPSADQLVGRKYSLRASLERLIIRYLRKLSPHENFDYDLKKRSLRSRRWASTTRATLLADELEGQLRNGTGEVHKRRRIPVGSHEIIHNKTSDESADRDEAEMLRRQKESRSFCPEQRRKVSSLDRFDIEQSYRNESMEDYNIRKILNRRCSGKNHCSFIFNTDHPFSKIWENGLVRVKYICMDDFRVNHYCGEHLTVGYELSAKAQWNEYGNNGGRGAGEPVAEARTQFRDQAYHSLKILKTSEELDGIPRQELPIGSGGSTTANESRKRKIKIHNPVIKQEPITKEQKGVYSQDFRVLKILPSNLDDFNDLEKIGDEIYFRKDKNILDQPIVKILNQSLQQQNTDDQPITDLEKPTTTTTELPLSSSTLSTPTIITNYPIPDGTNSIEGITTILHYPAPTDSKRIDENNSNWLLPPLTITTTDHTNTILTNHMNNTSDNDGVGVLPAIRTTISATTAQTKFKVVTINDIEMPYPTLAEPLTTSAAAGLEKLKLTELNNDAADNTNTNSNSNNESDNFEIILPESQAYDEDDAESFEDDSEEETDSYDEDNLYPTRKTYSSVQRTAFRSPLLHGFAMTPGYPKFYIGDSECSWRIFAPDGNQIRLTILDISLRYEETACKDFLEIVDLDVGHTLFNSCSEDIRPLEVISQSNQIEVIVKTTTKFAYPKRGILLHYSAIGCVNPPLPKHGRLVSRTPTTGSYQCDENFVFPDTHINSRHLVCTDSHTWNSILPDCIEELTIPNHNGSVATNFNYNSRKRPPEKHNNNNNKTITIHSKMSNKDADMVFDIIIPSLLIGGLFVLNGIVFAVIMTYRRRNDKIRLMMPKTTS